MSDKPDVAERIGTAITELDIDFRRFSIMAVMLLTAGVAILASILFQLQNKDPLPRDLSVKHLPLHSDTNREGSTAVIPHELLKRIEDSRAHAVPGQAAVNRDDRKPPADRSE
jgi:outer membrane lipopolysaccharide assembly protein LptE/RlpB